MDTIVLIILALISQLYQPFVKPASGQFEGALQPGSYTISETGTLQEGMQLRIQSHGTQLDQHMQHLIESGAVTLVYPEELQINGVGGYFELYVNDELTSGQQATVTGELVTGWVLHDGKGVVRTGSVDSFDVLLKMKFVSITQPTDY